MALSLDGSAHNNSGSALALTVTLTTANAGDVIILVAAVNRQPVVSVVSANLTWAFRANDAASSNTSIEMWYAIASGALSSEVITVTQSLANFITLDAFGISGADTASPFDASAVTGHPDPLSISTTAADTFIIGAYRESSGGTPTEGSGWTKISGADFQLTEYQIVSSPQSGLSVTQTTGAGLANGGIAQAIKMASAAGVSYPRLERGIRGLHRGVAGGSYH